MTVLSGIDLSSLKHEGLNANGLGKDTLLQGLLQYNYFPRQHDHKEELPPIFNTVQFTPAVAGKLNAAKARGSGYDVLPFRRTRHPNIPRMMGIPHPRAYAQLVTAIADNWDQHIAGICQSPNSQLEFGLHEDNRIVVHRYDHTAADGEVEDQNPLSDFGKKYRVKTDITNFYHSVYSHSLPWALVGHSHAKRHKGPKHKDEWFNRIDYSVTLCQRNETKGISIGPATSTILSEIILFQVDKVLRDEKGYQFTRYIDDYTAFVESNSKADQFLSDLTQELEKYALTLNPKKTSVVKMPVLSREDWVTDINLFFGLEEELVDDGNGEIGRKKIKFRQLKLIIDKAISLSKEYPDGSVIKYAFSAIIEIGIDEHEEEAEFYFQDAFLKYAYYFPTLIPLIQRWLAKTYPLRPNVEKRILALLDRSFEQGQSDNIIWCIYYLLQIQGEKQDTLLSRCCEKDDPMVVLMGYIYAKKSKLDLAPVITWANEKIKGIGQDTLNEYDIDRFWLVLYQLYHDGVVATPPYKEADDNKIFEILKHEKISFVDFDHEDFNKAHILAQKMFGGIIL